MCFFSCNVLAIYIFILLCLISDTDRDFDPSAEMLINEYDDERTLEEEENMSENSGSNELDDLEKVAQQIPKVLQLAVNLQWSISLFSASGIG